MIVHFVENPSIAPNAIVCSSHTATHLIRNEQARDQKIFVDQSVDDETALVSPAFFDQWHLRLDVP